MDDGQPHARSSSSVVARMEARIKSEHDDGHSSSEGWTRGSIFAPAHRQATKGDGATP